jgi:hypothetical protein
MATSNWTSLKSLSCPPQRHKEHQGNHDDICLVFVPFVSFVVNPPTRSLKTQKKPPTTRHPQRRKFSLRLRAFA